MASPAKFLEEALSTNVDESAVSAIVGSLQNHLQLPTVPANASGYRAPNPVVNNAKFTQKANGQIVLNAHPKGHQIVTVASSNGIVVSGPSTVGNSIIVNVNSLRAAAPAAASQTGAKTLSQPRLMLPQVVGARPGQPTQITLQALQGLSGQGNTLLIKNENGQYQLLRVGPGPIGQAGTTTTIPAGGYRLQTVPVCTSSVQSTIVNTVTQPSAPAQPSAPQKTDTKEKCRKFLTNLLDLSSKEPKAVERNVRTLIQELVDAKVQPEEFCDRLEKLLNASPQPCLINFLQKSLPLLRAAMAAKELTIEGIRPPPPMQLPIQVSNSSVGQSVVLSGPSGLVQAQLQVKANHARPVVAQQVRMVNHMAAPVRQQQFQKIITPLRMQVPSRPMVIQQQQQQPLAIPTLAPVGTTVRITTPAARMMPPPVRIPVKTQTVRVTMPPPSIPVPIAAAVATTPTPTPTPAPMPMPTPPPPAGKNATSSVVKNHLMNKQQPANAAAGAKQSSSTAQSKAAQAKDKKGFTVPPAPAFGGEDDVNDVAAMAGVNLAEESQRILGSTDFVGTQIRSCKEDLRMSSQWLIHAINKCVVKNKLEGAHPDVLSLLSTAGEELIKNTTENVLELAECRLSFNKNDPAFEMVDNVKGQMRFLEELDKLERKRQEEVDRELLLKAAKSRTKSEDPEQVKLKAKAKEMQRVEMEEVRQREANQTALLAIGPRKRIKLEGETSHPHSSASGTSSSSTAGPSRLPMPPRPRMTRVTLKDMQFYLENEGKTARTKLILYKSYNR